MSEAELKKAKLKRRTIKGILTRASTFLNSYDAEAVNIAQLRERKEKIVATWNDFDEVQSIIDLSTEGENEDDERQSFEDSYFEVISRFEELIVDHRDNNGQIGVAQNDGQAADNAGLNANNASGLRLPKIQLPTFSGGYEEWYPFHDTFQSLIHNEDRIPQIQKFHYLRSSLEGEAAEVIRSLEVSADNYVEAWQMLRQRYDNKRLIIQKHIKSIFDLPAVTKECYASLRSLIDGVLKHKRALASLGRSTEHWDDLLIYLITSKLDATTNREWENSLKEPTIPKLEDLTRFLEHRCHTLEIIQRKNPNTSAPPPANKHRQSKPTSSHVTTQNNKCPICKGEHFVFMCQTLLKMTIPDRVKAVRESKLCLNCLRSTSHQAKDCSSRGCKTCGKRHNTLLHFTSSSSTQGASQEVQKQDTVINVSTITSAVQNYDSSHVWLSTAMVQVLDSNGKTHLCRALLDPGSQSNLITENLAKKLGLPFQEANIPIVGVSQVMSLARNIVKITLISRHYSFQRDIDCLILKRITDELPLTAFNKARMNIPYNLRLADPKFHVPGEIDMLIGATVFWESLCVGQIKATAEHPVLQKTLFGWILGGASESTKHSHAATACNLITNQQLDANLTKFWECERYPERISRTIEEKFCEDHFTATHRRDDSGRFIVQLPFKKDILEQLGESKDTALRRFYALERKLKKNAELREQYVEFLNEYQRLGHMEPIKEQESVPTGYYLPHHPVIKETSSTTKLRVVFDASCKTSTGISLNDTLMVGPTLQQDLFDIIIQFRTWQYVMTSDIEKMYRQIRVDESQTQYQRILWRANPEEEVKTFELKTVTYGTGSASFLAIRALQEIAHLEEPNFPLGAAAVLSNFYVDDLLTGANNLNKAFMIRDEVIAILAKGGFKLRKWASNCEELLQNLPNSLSTKPVLTLNKSEQLSTLGLQWHSVNDTLQYEVKQLIPRKTVTKRAILSDIARIFDPLGLLGPVIVTAKILIQRLWLLKVDWDETVPLEIETKWREYHAQLELLNTLRIPRRVIDHSQPHTVQMHGFCDASMDAFGAVIYLRTTSVDGKQNVRLLCAKSRVAPAKSVTLPRLELCAAHLLAQLTHRTSKSLNIKLENIYHWSDSTITLGWIRADAKRWSTFVSNRVGQIQELTDSTSWRHVKTKENPADGISRGVAPSQLIQSQLWWNGPHWLNSDTTDWDAAAGAAINIEDLPEGRKNSFVATNPHQEWNIFYTSLTATKLIRSMAYILRFVENAKRIKQDRQVDSLTVQELNRAKIRLAKIVQGYAFAIELKALKKGDSIPRNSKLLGLSPFIDEAGVIRVGGRLSQSKLPYATKHPIVLPSKHNFTKMLIVHEHQRLLHAGPQSTLASLRQQFWPIAGRDAVRLVTRSCIKCFRNAPIARQVIMGDLPKQRVSPARPFIHCGIDYCGPFMVRESRRRNSKCSKAYVAVFVCLACKAIHLELVFDLSTESFLNALKRFISRRGTPSDIYTDNGTNFVGAAKELKELRKTFLNELKQDSVSDFSSQNGIMWHFIPPQSPHFGGLWEAAVKAMKFHLKRVAGTASLVSDEFQTMLVQIEAVLNSRPLIPLSSNPNDHTYLSPAHFLIEDNFSALSEPTLLDTKENRLSRWQRVEQIKQHFWKRWSADYLNELQQRTKWKTNAPSLKIDDLVIIREDNTPPLCWSLARVVDVHPGSDGVVRTATVKTTKGIYKRPITRLCPLPLDEQNSPNQ